MEYSKLPCRGFRTLAGFSVSRERRFAVGAYQADFPYSAESRFILFSANCSKASKSKSSHWLIGAH